MEDIPEYPVGFPVTNRHVWISSSPNLFPRLNPEQVGSPSQSFAQSSTVPTEKLFPPTIPMVKPVPNVWSRPAVYPRGVGKSSPHPLEPPSSLAGFIICQGSPIPVTGYA
jgi:hypothetical protein